MRFGDQLKQGIARELNAVIAGWNQHEAAALVRISQARISNLRRKRLYGLSATRLLRLMASQGYNVEVHLKPMERRFARPRPQPTITVIRYDRFGRAITSEAQ